MTILKNDFTIKKAQKEKSPKMAKHIGVGKSNLIQINITFEVLAGYLCESLQ